MSKKLLRIVGVTLVFLVFMVSMVSAAKYDKVEGDKECIVYQGSIEVDGIIDDLWENAPEIPVDIVKQNASLYYGDSSKVAGKDYAVLTCKTLWNPSTKEIYVLYIVEDKVASQKASLDWEKDSVELFIDLDNIRQGAKDSNSYQKRVYADEKRDGSDSTMISAVKITDTGYVVEISHILEDDVKPGDYIGIDFQCNDDAEGNGKRHVCLGWSDSVDQASKDTKVWGQALLSGQKVEGYEDPEPTGTEPDETEPIQTEPPETEPADTEPAETEPVETEPAETEPVETEPAQTEPTETEPGSEEPQEEESPKTSDAAIYVFEVLLIASLGIWFIAGLKTRLQK